MKIRNILSTIILILVLSLTVGFSAFVSEMSISNLVAEVRLNEDVRITNVELISERSFGVEPSELDYDTDSFLGRVWFDDLGSCITYKVTITNFGNTVVGFSDSDSDVFTIDPVTIEINDENEIFYIEPLGGTKELIVEVYPLSANDSLVYFNVIFDFKRVFNVSFENIDMDNEIVMEGMTFTKFLGGYEIEDISVYIDDILVDSSNYSMEYGTIYIPNVSGDILIKGPKTLNSVMWMNSALDTNVNFASSNGLDVINNITYTRSGTENDEYPIYYYRGNVTANNVIFGDFCWKMVRTTKTGGVKLIYNGVPSSDGSCDNTGTDSQIGKSKYNPAYTSFAYNGYMYNEVYEVDLMDMDDSKEIMYGSSITYSNGMYTLKDTFSTSTWSTDYSTIGSKYHYTCLNSDGTCSEVYYMNHITSKNMNYIILSGGTDLISAMMQMLYNVNSSTLKTYIDTWYEGNMTSFTELLENEKWCNDRSVVSGGWDISNSNITLNDSIFGSYKRNAVDFKPSLSCSAANNELYVGNGLTYPVALLTADEITLAGSGRTGYSINSYLYTGSHWWSLSPWTFATNMAYNSLMSGTSGNEILTYAASTVSLGVRPAISIKNNMHIASGDGSYASPYRIRDRIPIDLSYWGYDSLYYEPGMTWEEWVNSEYNVAGFEIDRGNVTMFYTYYIEDSSYNRVSASSLITAGDIYHLRNYI